MRPALAAFLALAGCSWHPVYGVGSHGSVDAVLQGVTVDLIPERTGQLLREALQARLQGADGPTIPRYELAASYGIGQEGIGILQDSSVTRIRLVARASYTLTLLGATRKTCLSGSARQVDGVDQANQQFFYTDLAIEAAQRRLTDAVADQMVERIAAILRDGTQPGCTG